MPDTRPTAAQRGYGARWQRKRARFLRRHVVCAVCPAPSKVADHYPRSRKELIADGVRDPDADEFLRPLCINCHNSETGKRQGNFARRSPRQRPAERHPGLIEPTWGPTPTVPDSRPSELTASTPNDSGAFQDQRPGSA